MTTLTALLLTMWLTATTVQFELAPDQPLNFVYTDDPLIVELRADNDINATLDVVLQQKHLNTPYTTTCGPFLLRAHGSHWCALEDAPSERGYYQVRLTLHAGEETHQQNKTFCRIDRVADTQTPWLCAENAHQRSLLALSAAAVRRVRIDLSSSTWQEDLQAALQAHLKLVLYLRPSTLPNPDAQIAELAQKHCDAIARWEIAPDGDIDTLTHTIELIRKAGCTAPVALAVPDSATLAYLLENGAGKAVRTTILHSANATPQEIERTHHTAAHAGYESWRVLTPPAPQAQCDGPTMVKNFLQQLAAGAAETSIDTNWIYDGDVQETLVYLNAFAQRFDTPEYLGPPVDTEGIRAYLFRNSTHWFLAFWTTQQRQDIDLPIGDAQNILLTDAFNNPQTMPDSNENGLLALQATPIPQYLTGVGGPLPGHAAGQQAKRIAQAFTQDSGIQKFFPAPLCTLVRGIAQRPPFTSDRALFFSLLRALPELEQQWHAGKLPKTVAVSGIAQLAQLLHALTSLEAAAGKPFLEPVQDTLAHCDEYQSLYLTGSVGRAHNYERGDWLVEEVRRLMERAQALQAANHLTEAAALAALAEWRARALEFAAKAGPLSELSEDAFREPEPEPEPEPEENDTSSTEGEAQMQETDAAEANENEAVPEPAPPEPKEITHTVSRGENASVIARKYKVEVADLMKWNKLTKRSILNIGDKLTITLPAEN